MRNLRPRRSLREEIEAGDDDSYLDATVKETLRLRPVIDAAERMLTVPRTVAGWELPAGVKVYPVIALVHLREDLFPRAHELREAANSSAVRAGTARRARTRAA